MGNCMLAFWFVFSAFSVAGDFLGPSLTIDRVDICTVVFISVGIHFAVLAEEGSLVECILVGHVARLRDLVQLCVKQVRGGRGMAILLSAEDKDLCLGYRACTEPIFDVVLKALRPYLDQFPVRLFIIRVRV